MRAELFKNNEISQIIYAESLNRLLLKESFVELKEAPSVLFISTQPFYERYYEKLTNIFEKKGQYHWYICPNNSGINSIEMFQKIISFIEEMKIPKETVIFGAGNEGVYHLCGVIEKNSPFVSRFIYVPTTMTGFIHALNGHSYLLNHSLGMTMEQFALPERVVYDTMLNELEPIDSWATDFYSLVKLGILYQKELLAELYQASKSEKHAAFSPFLKSIIEILQSEKETLDPYGLAVSQSFYQLRESHYLSRNQKMYIGFLLQTLWGIMSNEINFDFNKFYRWFEGIVGLDLSLPNQMITYDLAESIVNELVRYEEIEQVEAIGSVQIKKIPTIEEMYQVIDVYRNFK